MHVAEFVAEFKLRAWSAIENWFSKLCLILVPKRETVSIRRFKDTLALMNALYKGFLNTNCTSWF